MKKFYVEKQEKKKKARNPFCQLTTSSHMNHKKSSAIIVSCSLEQQSKAGKKIHKEKSFSHVPSGKRCGARLLRT